MDKKDYWNAHANENNRLVMSMIEQVFFNESQWFTEEELRKINITPPKLGEAWDKKCG